MHATLGALTVALVWASVAALLGWSSLPGRWRRVLALVTSVLGLACLLVAVGSEGVREVRSTGVLLIGTPYQTAMMSASASLPWYLLTGVCLALGTLGLGMREEAARSAAAHPLATAIGVSLVVLALRFLLELTAAPATLAWLFGVTWLPPVVGGFLWLRLRAEGRSLGTLVTALFAYGLAVRAAVGSLYVLATVLRLGSHYDLSPVRAAQAPWGAVYSFEPGSLSQIAYLGVLPQLLVWPVVTVVSGLLGAVVTAVAVALVPPSSGLAERPASGGV